MKDDYDQYKQVRVLRIGDAAACLRIPQKAGVRPSPGTIVLPRLAAADRGCLAERRRPRDGLKKPLYSNLGSEYRQYNIRNKREILSRVIGAQSYRIGMK